MEELAAIVKRELRAAVASQRRGTDPGRAVPASRTVETHRRAPSPDPESVRRQDRWRATRRKTVARWLYPLSREDGTRDDVWDLGRGRRKRVTLEAFAALVRTKRLDVTTWWLLTTNHRRMKTGDMVYLYASDDNAGIVGFAIAGSTRPRTEGGAAVQLHVDVRLSGRLIGERPVPATAIRRWLPPRTRPVESMTAYSHRLDLMLSRFHSHAGHVRRATNRN
jgi:hypothetical protein